MPPRNAVKIYRELAASPHARAEGFAFNDSHHEVLNTPANRIMRTAQSKKRRERWKCCRDAMATKLPTDRRRHTKAVKTCIHERYFLIASNATLLSGEVPEYPN